MKNKGFTLPEVMVALGIFSIGMIASFGLQISGMHTSRKTEKIKTMTEIASSELEIKRQYFRDHVDTSSTGQTCDSNYTDSGYGCIVSVQPCSFTGNSITCANGVTSSPVAHYITVTVSASGQPSFTLSALVRKKS